MNIRRLTCISAFTVCAVTAFAAEALPTFEVASIKMVDRGGISGHGSVSQSGPRVNFNGYTLTGLVMYAYDVRSYQVSGMPGWAGSDVYIIAAKAEGSATPSIPAVRQMLKSLL